MPEHSKRITDLFSNVSSIEDLINILPREITDKLGEGEKGLERTMSLLIGLAHFPSEPMSFSRAAFDDVVAIDLETMEHLSSEESQRMIEVGVETGFIKKLNTTAERYMFNPQVGKLVKKFLEQ